jgi:GMP synthase (glutamine-hydrolysing)
MMGSNRSQGAESRRPQLLVIRQLAFKGLGVLSSVFDSLGFHVDTLDAPSDDLASVHALDPDLVIVLGGPISAMDDQRFPFLRDELRIIEQRLQAGRPLLGICLGAQLIVRALGGRILPDAAPELGWWPLELEPAGQSSCLRYLDQVPLLHWHRDAMELPNGARCLASTDTCPVQAFSASSSVLGLQFHPEVGPQEMAQWLAAHVRELDAHPHQSVDSLREDSERCLHWMNQRADAMLRDWLSSQDEAFLSRGTDAGQSPGPLD